MAYPDKFMLKSAYQPTGDQPVAIEKLVQGLRDGFSDQTLMGVTGSGKTFTMANIIEKMNRPTLVLAHNKTLAAQLCTEFKSLFPDNAVEYFVSYYDYFQPEAYIPGRDIYIEKDSSVNNEIDKLRHSATSALFERRDVIVVSSVSCIYSLGNPEEYKKQLMSLRVGMIIPRDTLVKQLVSLQYTRNDMGFDRNNFRVRGDVVEIFPSNEMTFAMRVELFGDEIERISRIDTVTGEVDERLTYITIYPSTHYITDKTVREAAIKNIETELAERVEFFESENKLVEAQRIYERVMFDLEQIREIGFCSGVENYSRVLAGRPPGSVPYTLLDYFPKDFITFIDESHVTAPQVRGMGGGDTARKRNLIDYGFRLPSAYDNRPLSFPEFVTKKGQTVYVSATPALYEKTVSQQLVEQIIRPTGLLDPEVEVRPVKGQIDDLLGEIKKRSAVKERVLVTTLTRKMAEDLSEYLLNNGIKSKYLHYEIETIERIETLRGLRAGDFDVLVGINLLREGLDLPEVSLVVILDADKEGFLRNDSSLIQTIGRAARNANGKVIMYADKTTQSMRRAIDETYRRRKLQDDYNKANGIIPQTIIKEIGEAFDISFRDDKASGDDKTNKKPMSADKRRTMIEKLTAEMKRAAKDLDFETAAAYRDRIRNLMEHQ